MVSKHRVTIRTTCTYELEVLTESPARAEELAQMLCAPELPLDRELGANMGITVEKASYDTEVIS